MERDQVNNLGATGFFVAEMGVFVAFVAVTKPDQVFSVVEL